MVRVCVGCWHLMKWCSFRLTFLGVPKVRYATPEKQRFWSRFGSQLGGVLAQKGVVFFEACGS